MNERCVWKLRRRDATRVMASARASARALASDRHAINAISEILNAPLANILATSLLRARVSFAFERHRTKDAAKIFRPTRAADRETSLRTRLLFPA